MNILTQKIENAREFYNMKFLNEKFESKEENKLRKDKLNKLLNTILNDEKQIETKRKI